MFGRSPMIWVRDVLIWWYANLFICFGFRFFFSLFFFCFIHSSHRLIDTCKLCKSSSSENGCVRAAHEATHDIAYTNVKYYVVNKLLVENKRFWISKGTWKPKCFYVHIWKMKTKWIKAAKTSCNELYNNRAYTNAKDNNRAFLVSSREYPVEWIIHKNCVCNAGYNTFYTRIMQCQHH